MSYVCPIWSKHTRAWFMPMHWHRSSSGSMTAGVGTMQKTEILWFTWIILKVPVCEPVCICGRHRAAVAMARIRTTLILLLPCMPRSTPLVAWWRRKIKFLESSFWIEQAEQKFEHAMTSWLLTHRIWISSSWPLPRQHITLPTETCLHLICICIPSSCHSCWTSRKSLSSCWQSEAGADCIMLVLKVPGLAMELIVFPICLVLARPPLTSSLGSYFNYDILTPTMYR